MFSNFTIFMFHDLAHSIWLEAHLISACSFYAYPLISLCNSYLSKDIKFEPFYLLKLSFLIGQYPLELEAWKVLQNHILADYVNNEVSICLRIGVLQNFPVSLLTFFSLCYSLVALFLYKTTFCASSNVLNPYGSVPSIVIFSPYLQLQGTLVIWEIYLLATINICRDIKDTVVKIITFWNSLSNLSTL